MGNKVIPRRVYWSKTFKEGSLPPIVFSGLLDTSLTRFGVNRPKYRQNIKDGVSATNSVSTTFRSYTLLPAICSGQRRSSPTQPWVPISIEFAAAPVFPPSGSPDWMDLEVEANNKAVVKLHERIRENQRAISGPTFVAELSDTIRMLKRPASAIRDLSLRILEQGHKKAKRLSGRELERALASSLLEWRFGVQPLLSDTKAAAEACARLADDFRRSRVSSFGLAEELTVSDSHPGTQFLFTFQDDYQETGSVSIIYRAGLRARPRGSETIVGTATRLKDLCGFNLSEIAPAVWEIIPYSFVVDYFTNVGDLVSCWTTDLSEVTYVSRSTKYIRAGKRVGVVIPVKNATLETFPGSAGSWSCKEVSINRGSGIIPPAFAWNLPKFKQVQNLAALFSLLRPVR